MTNASWEWELRECSTMAWWSRKSRRKGSEKSISVERELAVWRSGMMLECLKAVVILG